MWWSDHQRDTHQNLKGDWGFQTISKTPVPLKRLTRLTRLSSWAVSRHIPWMPHTHTHTLTMAGHARDKRNRQHQRRAGICTHEHAPAQRRATSRALLTFSHVPLLLRVPAYGSYERPRGKTEQEKPCAAKCHPRSMDSRRTYTQG